MKKQEDTFLRKKQKKNQSSLTTMILVKLKLEGELNYLNKDIKKRI